MARLAGQIPLHALAIGFVAVACLIPAIFDGLRVLEDRATTLKESARDTANLARAVGQHADDALRMVDGVLSGFVERLEAEATTPEAVLRQRQFLMTRATMLPSVVLLAFIDSNGDVVMGSLAALPKINLADREYFSYHRDHNSREVHLSPPVIDRVKNKWIIPLTRRVNHPDGSFAGVMLAAMDVAYFERFYQNFDIGQNGAILLASLDGTLLVRRPFDESKIGVNLRDGEVFGALRHGGLIGNVEGSSLTDGTDRLNSYRVLASYPLVVAVARSKDEVLAPWRARAWSDVVGDLGMAVLI
ncbi:MAG TPA: cache domain-containing protein, partial [Stellaceae bacterium]|nr:cache domain-containing protein [Stellaceae bacterium]